MMNGTAIATERWPSRWLALAWLVLLLAAVVFVARGPARGLSSSQDWSLIYGSARAWLVGEDPYRGETAARVWREAGGRGESFVTGENDALLLYPPPSLGVLSLFAMPPWRWSVVLWVVVNSAGYLAVAWGTLWMARLPRREAGSVLALAALLMLGAAHTTIAMGQVSILAGAMIAAGAWGLATQRYGWAAVCMAMATAVKPQLGLFFLGYAVVRGGWRSGVWAGGSLGVVTLVGVGRLWLADIAWFEALGRNVRAFAAHDAGSPVGEYSYQLINLHLPLSRLMEHGAAVTAAAWLLTGGAAAAYLAAGRGRRGGRDVLLCDLAAVSVLTLLPLYHRYYDAVVLVFAIGLGFALWRRGMKGWAAATGVCLVPLLAPLPVAAQVMAMRGYVPEAIASSGPWRVGVIGLHAWALLLLGVVLVGVRRALSTATLEAVEES